MRATHLLLNCLALLTTTVNAGPQQTVHVFVALCDNVHQGIVKVPAKIGNGDDPKNNLYWGNSEGLKSYFAGQKDWKRVDVANPQNPAILERCVFRHTTGAWLVADAYQGKEIQRAITDFLMAAAGRSQETVTVNFNDAPQPLSIAGSSALVAYIGHNGLMDFDIPLVSANTPVSQPKAAIVLCCLSEEYFLSRLKALDVTPVLLTKQLMYPGSFLLKSALDGWMNKETQTQIRERAAQAYAANQHISAKAARGVFSKL